LDRTELDPAAVLEMRTGSRNPLGVSQIARTDDKEPSDASPVARVHRAAIPLHQIITQFLGGYELPCCPQPASPRRVFRDELGNVGGRAIGARRIVVQEQEISGRRVARRVCNGGAAGAGESGTPRPGAKSQQRRSEHARSEQEDSPSSNPRPLHRGRDWDRGRRTRTPQRVVETRSIVHERWDRRQLTERGPHRLTVVTIRATLGALRDMTRRRRVLSRLRRDENAVRDPRPRAIARRAGAVRVHGKSPAVR
jgi:hypothetical protein